MATVGTYNRAILSGGLPGGEVWSTSVAFADITGSASVGETDFTELSGWAQTWVDAIELNTTWDVLDLLSSSATILNLRIEARDAAGTLLQAGEAITNIIGEGSAACPFQTSVVSSLLTGRPGRSYRGRMYWPAIGAIVDPTTLRLDDPSSGGVATGVVQYLAQGETAYAGGLELKPVVVGAAADAVTEVTSVSVGDILDTQRRRRDRVAEFYTVIPY